MARCSSCNKFVSMEMSDPEVDLNDIEIDYNDDGTGTGTISGTVRIVRACAECGDELRDATLELMHGFKLPPKGEAIKVDGKEFEAGEAEHEFEVEEGDVNPIDGNGRRARFGAEVCFMVKCTCGCEFEYEGSMQDEVAASEMNELS